MGRAWQSGNPWDWEPEVHRSSQPRAEKTQLVTLFQWQGRKVAFSWPEMSFSYFSINFHVIFPIHPQLSVENLFPLLFLSVLTQSKVCRLQELNPGHLCHGSFLPTTRLPVWPKLWLQFFSSQERKATELSMLAVNSLVYVGKLELVE